MHTVAILAFDGIVAVDLVVPADVFGHARLLDGRPAYRVKVCGAAKSVRSTVSNIEVPHRLSAILSADTVIVPGIDRADRHVDASVLQMLRRAAARGARIASVCSGALVLAKTGLLDGLRATTHWRAADELAASHPAIDVDPTVLYIDNGQILTSAGGMASLDLCLYMIRRDHGGAVAAASARFAVVPLERSGGQAQFIPHEVPALDRGDAMARAFDWARQNLAADLTIDVLARRAAMSARSFARHFKAQTGTTPARWITRARIAEGQGLLETTSLSIECIAESVGFGSPTAFRSRFRDLVGVTPQEYRRSFRRP